MFVAVGQYYLGNASFPPPGQINSILVVQVNISINHGWLKGEKSNCDDRDGWFVGNKSICEDPDGWFVSGQPGLNRIGKFPCSLTWSPAVSPVSCWSVQATNARHNGTTACRSHVTLVQVQSPLQVQTTRLRLMEATAKARLAQGNNRRYYTP